MQFNTKFNINDKVFFLYNNKIRTGLVSQMSCECVGNPKTNKMVRKEKYIINNIDNFEYSPEFLFRTVDELLDNLKKDFESGVR